MKYSGYVVCYWEENMGTHLGWFQTKAEAEAYCEAHGWKHNGNQLNIVRCKALPACCFN